jgi:hypothetical protein
MSAPATRRRPAGVIVQPAEPVVICSGGSLNDRTYKISDWEHEVRAGQRLLEKGQHPAPVLGYELNRRSTTSHRSGLVGMPATWIGFEHLTVKGGVCR